MKTDGRPFGLCVVAYALMAGSPAASSDASAVSLQAGRQAVATLPGAGDDAFRTRMLSWSSSLPPPLAPTEDVVTVARQAGLAISSPFGWRADPILGIKRRHDGVDLPGASGTPIFATGAGVVRIAGWVRGYGNFIEILHPGGIATRYGHLSRLRVGRGATVGQGQLIGEMGSTGRSTGPHLHYEVRLDGVPVDPFRYMGQTAAQYRVSWAREIDVTPRWVGWAAAESATRLPEAEIR